MPMLTRPKAGRFENTFVARKKKRNRYASGRERHGQIVGRRFDRVRQGSLIDRMRKHTDDAEIDLP